MNIITCIWGESKESLWLIGAMEPRNFTANLMKQLLVQNAEINVPMLSFLNHGLKGKFIILMNHSDRT